VGDKDEDWNQFKNLSCIKKQNIGKKRCRFEILKEEEDADWIVRVCFHTGH
jgi:hypothetical protein